ncbi:hypothetical protein ACFLWG_04950, partial [Chloroflexota bacterium]
GLRNCGVLIHMEDGKPVKIVGDHDSPVNRGAICRKGLASLEYLYHPDRLKYPLKRVGNGVKATGSGFHGKRHWIL